MINRPFAFIKRFITAWARAFNSSNPTLTMTNNNPKANREFREMCAQQFSDELHDAGGEWSDCDQAMEEHWEDLKDILFQEIRDRAYDFIKQKAQDDEDGPDPSLSAAERNPNLR